METCNWCWSSGNPAILQTKKFILNLCLIKISKIKNINIICQFTYLQIIVKSLQCSSMKPNSWNGNIYLVQNLSAKYLGGKSKRINHVFQTWEIWLVKEGIDLFFYFCQSGKYYNLISVVWIHLFLDIFSWKRAGNLDTSIFLHQSLFTRKFQIGNTRDYMT